MVESQTTQAYLTQTPMTLSQPNPSTPPPFQDPLSVGMTPLVADRESLQRPAKVYIKIEGFELGGHFTDRVAVVALERALAVQAPPSELVLPALDRFAVSAAVQAAARWTQTKVTIFYEAHGEGLRLRQLVTHAGVKLRRGNPEAAAAYAAATAGAAVLSSPDQCPEAAQTLARELVEQLGHAPTRVVLPSEGALLAGSLSDFLNIPSTSVVSLANPPQPGLETEQLSPTFRAFGRQGILLSPEGAAVVVRARELADTLLAGDVVAVLPDGGSRHFGWAPGW